MELPINSKISISKLEQLTLQYPTVLFEVIRSEQICFIMLQVELKPKKLAANCFKLKKKI